jgi:hypothetical protein
MICVVASSTAPPPPTLTALLCIPSPGP